jgi:hypothetical protein
MVTVDLAMAASSVCASQAVGLESAQHVESIFNSFSISEIV